MTAPPEDATTTATHIAPALTAPGLTTTVTAGARARQLPTLTVIGYLDLSTVTGFDQALCEATTGRKVILDLTRADFLGTAAISVLFNRRDTLAAVLVSPGSIVAVALGAAGFPTIPTHAPIHQR